MMFLGVIMAMQTKDLRPELKIAASIASAEYEKEHVYRNAINDIKNMLTDGMREVLLRIGNSESMRIYTHDIKAVPGLAQLVDSKLVEEDLHSLSLHNLSENERYATESRSYKLTAWGLRAYDVLAESHPQMAKLARYVRRQ